MLINTGGTSNFRYPNNETKEHNLYAILYMFWLRFQRQTRRRAGTQYEHGGARFWAAGSAVPTADSAR